MQVPRNETSYQIRTLALPRFQRHVSGHARQHCCNRSWSRGLNSGLEVEDKADPQAWHAERYRRGAGFIQRAEYSSIMSPN